MHALSIGLGGEAPLAGVHDECVEAALGITKVRLSKYAKQGGEPLLFGILGRGVVLSLFTKVATGVKKPVCLLEQLLYWAPGVMPAPIMSAKMSSHLGACAPHSRS